MSAGTVDPVSSVAQRVVLRPLGTPLPLGFLGLMVATGSFATVQLGWVGVEQGRFAAYAAVFFTAPVQLLASVLGFLGRDSVAGTGMGVLAGTWAALGIATLTSPPGALSPGIGVVLVFAAAALLVPALAAGHKLVVAGVIGLSALRFLLTGVAMTTQDQGWLRTAGWCGLVLAALSLYAALALELESTRRRAVLPLLRRGPGASEATSLEPGVRTEL